ncbi:curli-like amyloid fiber formation chaperone CsgH [Pseudomonas putida]|uniref:curli-like amyloid fiber formation chaperone CsgH n=1 Tax=Pseudomonas putida TaxID=303 RepID=UPI00370A5092
MIDISQLVVSIDTQRNGEAVLIRPQLQSPTPLTLQYRLSVRQTSSNGTLSTSQSGDLQNGVASSFVQISLPSGATCQIRLEVLQDNQLLKQLDRDCE